MKKETEEILQDLKNQSSKNLEAILRAVVEFSEMMENIEAASQEHASGINQVNQAISEMDQMTQENASMVEQNAVASQNMAQEANRLRKMFISTKNMNHQLEQATSHHPNQEIGPGNYNSRKGLPHRSKEDQILEPQSKYEMIENNQYKDDFK